MLLIGLLIAASAFFSMAEIALAAARRLRLRQLADEGDAREPGPPALARVGWNPRFEVTETVDAYFFKGDVPGVKPEDLEISATGNRLQITGKRDREQETKSETVFAYEREFGTFLRTFTLPASADVEHAKSELKDGVLTLVIPKKAGMQAKKIAIGSPAGKS